MANLWTQFKALLPDSPLLVGTVLTAHSDNSVTVTLLGGGSMRVSGTGTEGQRVFIRNGVIEGEAPDLPEVMIEI